MKKLILASLAGMVILAGCAETQDGKYAIIAQCLTDKNVKFYGAWWCPHCSEQKKLFGDDLRYITYVECAEGGDLPANVEGCKKAGVERYPTWVFPGQGLVTGVQTPEALANKANCKDPNLAIEGAMLDGSVELGEGGEASSEASSEAPSGEATAEPTSESAAGGEEATADSAEAEEAVPE